VRSGAFHRVDVAPHDVQLSVVEHEIAATRTNHYECRYFQSFLIAETSPMLGVVPDSTMLEQTSRRFAPASTAWMASGSVSMQTSRSVIEQKGGKGG
jgi:hypothetical protein